MSSARSTSTRRAAASCSSPRATGATAPSRSAMTTFHDFTLKSIDGTDQPLAAYKGKVVLAVNVASQCGFTPQYKGLQALHTEFAGQGLVVAGIPANDFGAQEPGTDAQIKSF